MSPQLLPSPATSNASLPMGAFMGSSPSQRTNEFDQGTNEKKNLSVTKQNTTTKTPQLSLQTV